MIEGHALSKDRPKDVVEMIHSRKKALSLAIPWNWKERQRKLRLLDLQKIKHTTM